MDRVLFVERKDTWHVIVSCENNTSDKSQLSQRPRSKEVQAQQIRGRGQRQGEVKAIATLNETSLMLNAQLDQKDV